MQNSSIAKEQIKFRFQRAKDDYRQLLSPLTELSEDSSSLIQGYAAAQPRWNKREDMIPYYHVLGRSGNHSTVRALIVGGWSGRDVGTTYALSQLIAALEARFQLVDGIEATIYPVVNTDARLAGVELTDEQASNETRLWRGSDVRHVRVIEKELWRYDYDLAISVREVRLASEASVSVWANSNAEQRVFNDALARYGSASPDFKWEINPAGSKLSRSLVRHARKLTPVPDRHHQPTEVVIGLPGLQGHEEQAGDGVGLLLTLLHATRQARAEGLL